MELIDEERAYRIREQCEKRHEDPIVFLIIQWDNYRKELVGQTDDQECTDGDDCTRDVENVDGAQVEEDSESEKDNLLGLKRQV